MITGPLPPEDQARADFYALLARLFYAPPDQELLNDLAAAGEIEAVATDSSLAQDWQQLKRAAANADAEAVREEYESAFIGTGRAEITLYAGAYLAQPSGDNPLVGIRDFMAQHGFVRRNSVTEPEDHVAALCELMRQLIVQRRGMDAEQSLFTTYVWQAANPLCDAIAASSGTRFYKFVAALARTFFAVEHSAFDLA